MNNLEKISYAEAREWFWIRTAVWCIPAFVVSVASHFVFTGDLIRTGSGHIWFSIVAGMVTVLIGVLAALISMQLPWMRVGWRFGFILTGPACAVIGGLVAFMLGGIVLSYMQSDILHMPPVNVMSAAYEIMQFSIGAGAFWGFIFGSWFAIRRDRYFVESI